MTSLDQIPGASRAVLLGVPSEDETTPTELAATENPVPATTADGTGTDLLPAEQDSVPVEPAVPTAEQSSPSTETSTAPDSAPNQPPVAERPAAAAPTEPELLDYPAPPRFEWASSHAVLALLGGSLGFSVLGQVLFWGSFFTNVAHRAFPGLWPGVPWLVALALGGILEAAMVVFSELGLKHRSQHVEATCDAVDETFRAALTSALKSWLPWFLVGVGFAFVCTGINVAHWWSADRTAAFTFGAVGAVGFLAHVAKGISKNKQHVIDCRKVRAENARRWALYQDELAAWRQEKELADQRHHDREMARIAAHAPTSQQQHDRPAQARPKPAEDAPPEPKSAKRKTPSAKGPKTLDREMVIRWARENGVPGHRPEPGMIKSHFEREGYEEKAVRTYRRWLEKAEQDNEL